MQPKKSLSCFLISHLQAFDSAQNIGSHDSATCLLRGVPISVKESLGVKGTMSTGGLVWRLRHRCKEDSLIVQVIRKAGALIMCTGNVPQLMMMPECYNHIVGRARNPWDLKRTPGGSSGGDAALVAMGCVPLAIGSDVAGSLRIPASFCGVVALKPTSTRLTTKGCMRPRKVSSWKIEGSKKKVRVLLYICAGV